MKTATFTAVDATNITFRDLPLDLVTHMTTGHAFVEIYTASKRETVLVCALTNQTRAAVQRGMRGTTAQRWEPDACVCVIEKVRGVCPPSDGCADCDPLAALTVGACLTLDRPTGRLDIKRTGVAAGSYGGAVVNDCGQLVSIPPNWPASALPVFDPCCAPGATLPGTADDQTALEVPYTPVLLAPIATGTNVQVALQQVEAALQTTIASMGGGFGVTGVTGTAPIAVAGTPSAPVIGHALSGLAAGNYGGFTFDATGHATAYVAPVLVGAAFAVTGAVTVVFSPAPAPLGTYTFGVAAATVSTPGVVQIVNPGDISGNTVPLTSGGFAVSWDGLNQFFQGQAAAVIPRQTLAAGSWLLQTNSLVANGQFSCSATLVSAGVLEVDISPAAPSIDYQTVATLRGDTSQVWVENLTASKLRIHWVAGGVNTATHLDFHVVELQ